MTLASTGYMNTARTIASLSQQRSTGRITFATGDRQWHLYFFHGRLVYSTGNVHQMRRWHRALKRHCPSFKTSYIPQTEPWEYQLLSHWVTRQHLNVDQARAVIQDTLEEILFSLISNPALTPDWSSIQRFPLKSNSALSLLLSAPQIELALRQAQQLWNQWKTLELEATTPYMSPALLHLPQEKTLALPALPAKFQPLLTGQHTLWDIASQIRHPVTVVTRFLLPWIQQGAIVLRELPDLPLTNQQQPVTPKSSTQVVKASGAKDCRPRIACIDDSLTVGKVMESILSPAGYRLIHIQEPLSGIATLLEYKPDLILLDLAMPETNGYNLCNFLRKTSAFQNTPIIILTSQDGILDRTRARLVGASDFLAKASSPETMLNLVKQHLQPTPVRTV